MCNSNSRICNVLAIHSLDVMDVGENGTVECRLIVLEQNSICVLIEPILDYLHNDTILSGMAISQVQESCNENTQWMIVERQRAAGYQSSSWKWISYPLKDESNVEIFPIFQDSKLENSISITSKNGNLVIFGLK